MMIYAPPVADGAYPPPPPGIALDKKVYLPGIFAESALVCVKPDFCERLEVKTWVNDIPVYFTEDEGIYNILYMAGSFDINGKRYVILNSGSVPDLYYLADDDNPYSAYIVIWLDGQWFFMGLFGG